MSDRRGFLKGLSSLPVIGSLMPAGLARAAVSKRDYFKELGVRPFINAAGTFTTLTASLMEPEVVEAIEYASRQFVHLIELQEACGKRIAELIGSEAAMISSGAAGALTAGTAACVAGKDQSLIRRLPDTTGMKNEVIIQKSHRYGYDHSVRAVGIKFVEVETAAELESAVNSKTAMMLYFNAAEPLGSIKGAEFVALGKKHNVPTFNDAAADVPPVENLTKYVKMGFDLVTFSGGKGMRGPQSAGLLLGRKDLIEAARLNTSPYGTMARGQKVNKEEILGMMVAVERFMRKDWQAEWKEWERRIKVVDDSVASIKGVKTEMFVPEIANHVPHLKITWDESQVKIKPVDAIKQLREGEPSIEFWPGTKDNITVSVWMLQPGEVQKVAKRLRDVLKGAAA